MKLTLIFAIIGLFTTPLAAQQEAEQAVPDIIFSAPAAALDTFLWKNRPLVVFSDSENDPRFETQMELLKARLADLAERDVVILTDTDPAAKSDLRQKLRPHGFMLVLMGKDGNVYLRKPLPWNVREISRSIDKLPMRQQEVRERRSSE